MIRSPAMEVNHELDLKKIRDYQRQFVKEREWEKFHTPKNLAMALTGEAGELLEIFQWLTEEESKSLSTDNKKSEALRHEIADIFYYLLRLCDVTGIDLETAFWEKAKLNEKKYPPDLARGSARKYTEYAE